MTNRKLLTASVVGVAASLALVAAQAGGAAPRVVAAVCQAGQLHGRVGSSSGAAGTIALSIVLRNGGPACTLKGYARLRLRNASGPLPTHVRHGGIAFLNQTPKRVTLAHGARASILIAYTDVPTGAETTCTNATKLIVRPPGGGAGFVPVDVMIGACNRGTLRESPILAGVLPAQ